MPFRDESDQPLIRWIVPEQPQPLLGVTQRVRLASLLQTEPGEVQKMPRRRQIAAPQRDAGLDVACARGKMIDDPHQPIVSRRKVVAGGSPRLDRRDLLPCRGGELAIGRETRLAQNIGVSLGGSVERPPFTPDLASEEILGQRDPLGRRGLAGGEMDVSSLLQKTGTPTAGIVDPAERRFDPRERIVRQLPRDDGTASGNQCRDEIEGILDAARPVLRLMMIDEAAGRRRCCDRLPQAHRHRLVVTRGRARHHVQAAKQAVVAFGLLDEEIDRSRRVPGRKPSSDPRHRPAVVLRLGCGERRRHQVFAEPLITEGRAGAFTADRLVR